MRVVHPRLLRRPLSFQGGLGRFVRSEPPRAALGESAHYLTADAYAEFCGRQLPIAALSRVRYQQKIANLSSGEGLARVNKFNLEFSSRTMSPSPAGSGFHESAPSKDNPSIHSPSFVLVPVVGHADMSLEQRLAVFHNSYLQKTLAIGTQPTIVSRVIPSAHAETRRTLTSRFIRLMEKVSVKWINANWHFKQCDCKPANTSPD